MDNSASTHAMTDGQTPYRYIDHAPRTASAVPVITLVINDQTGQERPQDYG